VASAVNRVGFPSITSAGLWDGVVETLRRVTVQIIGPAGNHGAGVVWSADGQIVTNAHVVSATSMIRLHDGRTFRAQLLCRDENTDLVALSIPARGIEPAKLRDSRTLRIGELAVAVGHPMGETGAISSGIVHAGSRRALIETDIRLAPGNSGGPLADAAGNVIGINCMVVNGLGIAISTATIHRFLRSAPAAVEGAG
jgi:serine protease Do